MSYTKTNWVDQAGQVRYGVAPDEEEGLFIITPNYEEVTEMGTPVNAANLNHIENGIEDAFEYVDTQIIAMLGVLYPVGSIYIGTQETCPLETLGIGTWALVSDGRVLQGADSSHAAGTTIAAGLPNITGEFLDLISHDTATMGNGYGVFKTNARTDNTVHYMSGGATSSRTDGISFNASRSSAVYRNDVTTVQPPAYVVNIWRRTT